MIKTFTSEKFKQSNAYLIHRNTKNVVLIDTGFEKWEEIIQYIKINEMKLEAIFITHGHFDHAYGLDRISEAFDQPPIYINFNEVGALFDPLKNHSLLYENVGGLLFCNQLQNMKMIKNGDVIEVAGNTIKATEVAGHTQGMMMYDFVNLKCLFNGDNIYLKRYSQISQQLGVDVKKIRNSMINILQNYPKGYLLFPGHEEYGFPIRDVFTYNSLLKKLLEYESEIQF